MRIVIDSNVWISALVFGGNPRRVLERCVQDGIGIVLSDAITTEVRRNLGRKFADFLPDFEALLVALNSRIVYVTLGSLDIDVCRDPDDNRVLETAVLGKASYIISGDKDLLILGEYDGIRIILPTDDITLV